MKNRPSLFTKITAMQADLVFVISCVLINAHLSFVSLPLHLTKCNQDHGKDLKKNDFGGNISVLV